MIRIQKSVQNCFNRKLSHKVTIMMVHASNDSYGHHHFVATFHALKHDRTKAKPIT